jgi:glycosyltransferase involved in cell wall biosynthesis
MKISVVIPLYNKAPYIHRALHSVLRQSVQDIECIVVDDGSTDGGGDLAQKADDPRIRVVRQGNGGVSQARNKGISTASHSLIAFLDADDEWLPGFLEASLEMHEQYPNIVASFSNYQQEPEGKAAFRGQGARTGVLKNYFDFCLRHHGRGMCSSTVVARRDTLLRIGGFPIGRPMGEDLDTWFRLACAGPVAYAPKPLAVYHNAGGAATTMETNADVWPTFRAYANANLIPKNLTRQAEKWAAFTRIYTVISRLRSGKEQGANLLRVLPLRLLLNSASIKLLITMAMPRRLRHFSIRVGEIIARPRNGLSRLSRHGVEDPNTFARQSR